MKAELPTSYKIQSFSALVSFVNIVQSPLRYWLCVKTSYETIIFVTNMKISYSEHNEKGWCDNNEKSYKLYFIGF